MTIFKDEQASRIVFHYNKKHNEDPSIPTWVIKRKGSTYYVNHMESSVGFKTKETPDNPHTKGSIQFFGKLQIENENEIITAYIS